jgi:hypothetical protein
MVRAVVANGGAARSGLENGPHHHFICERRSAVEDIHWFNVPFLHGGSRLGGGRCTVVTWYFAESANFVAKIRQERKEKLLGKTAGGIRCRLGTF